MRDAENEVFTEVATMLRAKYAGIYVTGETVSSPPKWPCAVIQETDNYDARENMDSASGTRMSVLTYRIDVYSNKASGRKSECKSIVSDIESLFYRNNFTRLSRTPLNDLGDKIYHIVGTYRVKFDGERFYRI